MQRPELIDSMVRLLQNILEGQPGRTVPASASLPLVGAEAALASLELVSFIVDVETMLNETKGLDVTLVSEQALSRKRSPFRSIETLADYILELAGASGSGT